MKINKKRKCHKKRVQPLQYDTGLLCMGCKAPLHLAAESVPGVIEVIRSGGAVIMVCVVCGQWQMARGREGKQG